MKRFSMWMCVAAMFCGLALLGRASADDKPDGPPPKQDGGPRGRGGEGGGPGGPPPGGIHLIPRFAAEKLNLTDDQKKQIADLEKECKDKLAKILSPEQMKTLESARPPRRGEGGQGGREGGPGGREGGPRDGQKGGPGGGDQDAPRPPK